jgi:SAM-dependent methyltransferase
VTSAADPQAEINARYRALVRAHGAAPAGAQMSEAGQRFRFEKLLSICDLDGLTVLDLGCGPGAFFPPLHQKFPRASYTGIDILPEMIETARSAHPDASFLCRDILADGLPERYDVVLLSTLFNNARPDAESFLRRMIGAAWAGCHQALGFNFISTHVGRRDDGMAYHDPAEVLRFSLDQLSPRTVLHHHYERCDVAMFVYR